MPRSHFCFLHQLLSCCKCCIAKMATVGCLSPGPSGQLIRRCRAYFRACVCRSRASRHCHRLLCSRRLPSLFQPRDLATSPTRTACARRDGFKCPASTRDTESQAVDDIGTICWLVAPGQADGRCPRNWRAVDTNPRPVINRSLFIALIAPLAVESGLPQYPKRLWMDMTLQKRVGSPGVRSPDI